MQEGGAGKTGSTLSLLTPIKALGIPATGYSRVFIADLQVLGSAFFFGIGFLGQRAVSVHGLGTMTCNAFRFGLSTILLVACLPLIPPDEPNEKSGEESGDDEHRDRDELEAQQNAKSVPADPNSWSVRLLGPTLGNYATARKTVWFWGVFLGFVNFGASGFQQLGIHYTSASKVAFIAGFDLFLTPILGLMIPTFKRNAKVSGITWFAVCTSIIGIYQLSGTTVNEFEIGTGELLTLISTVFWTLHITYTDISTNYVDSLSQMCVQLGVVTLLSSIAAIVLEPQEWLWDHIFLFLPWLIFLAISEGLGFTLMAVGQTYSPPTHAAIILSLEGVFAAVSSYFLLGEHLTWRELSGCALMLLSTLIAELANVKHSPASGSGAGAGSGDEGDSPSGGSIEMAGGSSSTGVGGGSGTPKRRAKTTYELLSDLVTGVGSRSVDGEDVVDPLLPKQADNSI